MTTQNIPMALVMMIRKDAVELSKNMAWSPKKKMVQEELIKMLDIWEDEKYDEEDMFERGMLDEMHLDEDEDGYDDDVLYMLWLEYIIDGGGGSYIKKASKIAGIPDGEEVPLKLRMGWY